MFNIEEISFMKSFDISSREKAIADIKRHFSGMQDYDMLVMAARIVNNLTAMSDMEYAMLDFDIEYEDDKKEVTMAELKEMVRNLPDGVMLEVDNG